MKKVLRKQFSLAATAFTLGAVLVAPTSTFVYAQEDSEAGVLNFETAITHEGEAIEGGTLRHALVGDPFAGVLNNMLYSGNPDATIIGYFNEALYGYDSSFAIDNSGFADIEFDVDNKQVTISIPEGTSWDDGEPLTIDDVIFPYYVIGDPEYTGVRYGSDFQNVVGMTEYNAGEAEEISGLERIDDYTLRVTYINFNNSMLQAGGGVSSYVEPEHILGEVPVAELEDHAAVRTNPVGFGPFRVVSITPGEAVNFEANEYYYNGQPAIDNLVIEVVNSSSIVAELKAGNYDLATLPADQYDTYADATNFSTIGQISNAYTYIGFKQGTWDAEAGEVVPDESLITSSKALRQAMAYAVDNDAVGAEFYSGLRQNANSLITPNFVDYYNSDQEAYSYNPEKAKELLAEAGFVDGDDDGFVEDLNGEPFTLGFASMSGGEVAEPLAQYYIQMWGEIGVSVELVDGQLMEFNSFYDRVEADDPAIDIYQGAWGTGGDPNPSGLYGRTASFNYTRFASDEHDALLEAIESDESFEDEFRANAFNEWQAYVHEELPVIPTLFRYELVAVNNRVSQYDAEIGADLNWTEITLTADSPIAE